MFSYRSLFSFRSLRNVFSKAPGPTPRPAAAREACARFLARAARAERALRASSGLARVAGGALGAAALLLALDLVLGPRASTRAALALALGGATGLAALVALVSALSRRSTDRWLARRTEERVPELDGRLLAVASAGERASLAIDSVAPSVERLLESTHPADVPDRAALRRGLGAAFATALLASLVVAAYAALAPDRLGRALALEGEPGSEGPARLLAVRPGAASVREGRPLAIEVGAEGEPREAFVLVRPSGSAAGEARRVPLERRACGRFGASLPPFVEDSSYRVVLDEASSPDYDVTLIRAPRVVSIEHHEEYPAYLELAPRDVPGGDVEAFEGTRVLVRATTSSAPLRGSLRAIWTEDGIVESLPLVPVGPRVLEGSFTVKRSGSYRVEYDDASGQEPRPSASMAVISIPDQPPRVDVLSPAADREVLYDGSVVVDYEARDDHALGELALHVVVHGGRPHKLPLEIGSDPRLVHGRIVLSPRQLGLLPGDTAIYYLAARDRKAPIANRATSAPYVLAVQEDSKLREALTGIEPRDEELFKNVESSAGTPEGDADIARNQEALRRLERILAREPTAEPPGEDAFRDLAPEDLADAARALEDLEQDDDSVIEPLQQPCPDCDRIAKSSGTCPKCGRKNRCGSCGKPGHGRGCEAPPANAPDKAGGDPAHGVPAAGRGARGEQTREAVEGARRTFVTRVGSARELTRIYRELLERRRELLRRLADELAKGNLPADVIARLGPEALRLLEALEHSSDRSGEPIVPTRRPRGRAAGPPPRALKVRPEIPEDTVDLRARRERSSATDSAPEPSRAPAWDEALPPDLRNVVKAYFRRTP